MGEPRLIERARARLSDLDEARRTIDRAASDFMALLDRDLPGPVRDAVLEALRAAAGAEALAVAFAEGQVVEPGA